MPDPIARHRESIWFISCMLVGIFLIVVGVVWSDRHAALIALGTGALGLPEFHAMSVDYGRRRSAADTVVHPKDPPTDET